jgi:hypothetical protein
MVSAKWPGDTSGVNNQRFIAGAEHDPALAANVI